MDGDSTAKTFESGANSAMKDTDLTSGIHETVNQTVRLHCTYCKHCEVVTNNPYGIARRRREDNRNRNERVLQGRSNRLHVQRFAFAPQLKHPSERNRTDGDMFS